MRGMLRLESLSRAFSTVGYRFRHGSSMIPHPDKAAKGGEDACFASDNVIAVADGVGGWADYGIDPGLYSKKLCKIMQQLYSSPSTQKDYINYPQNLLGDAVRKNTETGTSTVCVVTLEETTGVARSAYLGDSTYTIYRISPSNNKLQELFAAPEQQRQFNFPYQVGTQGDSPELAAKFAHQLAVGDVIVAGSDGLWDNLHPNELTELVNSNIQNEKKMAEEIAKAAYRRSLSTSYPSPFHEKAKKAKLYYPPQGKSDDITVVAATVVHGSQNPTNG